MKFAHKFALIIGAIYVAILALTVSLDIVRADDAGFKVAKSHEITLNEAVAVGNALRQLNTYTVMSKDNTPTQLTYRFEPSFLVAMINDLRQADLAQKTAQDSYAALIKQFSDGKDKLPDTMTSPKTDDDRAKVADFNAKVAKIGEAPAGVLMTKIKESDLKLDVNPIPPAVLVGLLPILEK